ncbi:hypothetical protein FBEOM_11526 [Fusarium beomiforme]|uniref:Uncharacterized protein n=1 Tax=Fusarium beomiforme TaxID=44412 RepID=A0A9P5A9Q6_9HYPO|nr:hypothetical protein FBEOM_11526 [Fusarium beomiforme]
MATPGSNTSSRNLRLPSTRITHAASDSSRARGRIIFRPRRTTHVRYRSTSHQHDGHRSNTSPPNPVTQTTHPKDHPRNAIGANSSAVEIHPHREPEWMDDFEPDSAAPGLGDRYQTRPARVTRPRRDISSSSGYVSNANLRASKGASQDVSSLHMSEIDVSASPRTVSHLSLRGQLSTLEADACPAPLQAHATDVFYDRPIPKNHRNVTDELVDVISRNIAQQLHMLSVKDKPIRGQDDSRQLSSRTSDGLNNESRTPSQREELNLFTQELQRYAEQSGAKGKLPIPTPTPPRSGTSLHTIGALLPFRSEFKAAGLAITSKDQARYPSRQSPVTKARAAMTQPSRSDHRQRHLLQVNGNAGCPSSSTEIPFPVSKDMDEFRYTMVDQSEPLKSRGKKAEAEHKTSTDLKQSALVQPRPRRCHSLSADILVPQQVNSTKKAIKPLPELTHPDPSSTSSDQSYRLSDDSDVSPSTLKKKLDTGEAKASVDRKTKYESTSISPNHVTFCSRGFYGRKKGRPNVPKRTSSIRSLRAAKQDYDQDEILDRDVLRGLHIAASAACNEQIDAFIHEKTGLHIRQFLADLIPLESLGNETVRESKEERARRRRADIREVKRRVRESRQMRESHGLTPNERGVTIESHS